LFSFVTRRTSSVDAARARRGDPRPRAADVGPAQEVDRASRLLEANPGQVAAYKGGKEGLLGFFVGQVMKETRGKANAKVVNERIREKLST
jgi:aspartyl-tRNA(Asn)/glutamyl-tRNA(Gln) amidotransferase subunit B